MYRQIEQHLNRIGVPCRTDEVISPYTTFRIGGRVALLIEPETELKHRLLMLSSPFTSTFNWRKLVPELAQLGCLMVLVDLPGFGESDSGPGVPHDDDMRAHMTWGILDEIDRRMGEDLALWHLMAHGSACRTILTMANEYPDSVRSQIHVSPLLEEIPLPRPLLPFGGGRSPEDKWYDRNILSAEGFQKLSEQLFARPTDDYVTERMRHCLTRPGVRDACMHVLHGGGSGSEPSKGFAPVMALWGGRDVLMSERICAAVKHFLPEAEKHVLKGAGHFPMETHSKAMRDYLRGWLRYVE